MSLQSNPEIIKLTRLKEYGGSRYESKKLKSDEDIVCAMLESNGYAYYQVSPSIKRYMAAFIQYQIDKYTRINVVLSKVFNNDINDMIIKYSFGHSNNKLIKQLMDMKLFHQ